MLVGKIGLSPIGNQCGHDSIPKWFHLKTDMKAFFPMMATLKKVRPKFVIYTTKQDNEHTRPFHRRLPLILSSSPPPGFPSSLLPQPPGPDVMTQHRHSRAENSQRVQLVMIIFHCAVQIRSLKIIIMKWCKCKNQLGSVSIAEHLLPFDIKHV